MNIKPGKLSDHPLYRQLQESSGSAEELIKQLFHLTVGMSIIPTGITNRDGKLLCVNPAFSELLGYSEEELLSGRSNYEHKENRNEERELLQQLDQSEQGVVSMEARYQGGDGEEIWAMLNIARLPGLQEGKGFYLRQLFDFTPHKEVENELRENHRLLKAAINAAQDVIYVKDLQGRYTLVNEAAAAFLHKGVDEIIGKSNAELFAPELAAEFDREDREIVASGQSQGFEHFRNRDGRRETRISMKSVCRDDAGNVLGVLGIARDITERKEMEQALRESEERLRHYFDSGMVGMTLVSIEEGIIDCNQCYCEITGYSREELMGKGWQEITWPEDRAETVRELDRMEAGESDEYILEKRYRRKDGTPLYVRAGSRCVRHADGSVKYFVGFAQDISAEKEAQRALVESEERLRQYFDAGMVGMILASGQREMIDCNDRYCEITGYTVRELRGTSWDKVTHPDDREMTRVEIEKMLAGESDFYILEKRYQRKDGTPVHVRISCRCIRNDDGSINYFVSFVQDISERKQAEEALRMSEERFRGAFDFAAIPMVILTPEGRYVKVNRAMCSFTGYTEEELLMMEWQAITHPDDVARNMDCVAELLADNGKPRSIEKRYIQKSGGIRWGLASIAVLHNGQGEISHIISQVQDITEARYLSEQLTYQATHDALTGLVNRMEFEHRLGRVINSSRKSATEHALAYMDLDQFKLVNDTCGHIAGDELLKQVTGLISQHVRKRDTLARLGGDEFGLLMEGCSLENATRVVNDLRETVEAFQFLWEGQRFNIGVSIGLVPIGQHSGTITDVMKQADSACYVAKEGGRNRVHIYHPDDEELARRYGEMQWVTTLNEAIESDRFELLFQPIFRLGAYNGERYYEALIRLRDEEGKLIKPGRFLPAAERYGIASRLDQWVVERIAQLYENDPDFDERNMKLAINISGQSLLNETFLNFLGVLLNSGRLPAEAICFEIPEAVATSHLARAINFIKTLKVWGCQFALDDYGSGVSSFAYLKSLPVNILKIDGHIVREMESDPVARATVRSINEIAHLLGKMTIAESVESEVVLEQLKEMGVDFAQGTCLGHPEPIEKLQ